jgi:proteic killer suppression protein
LNNNTIHEVQQLLRSLLRDTFNVIDWIVIKGFRCKDTEAISSGQPSRKFQSVERAAKRRLDVLDAATSLSDLAFIRSNGLEALKADRLGQHSIRVNDQFRICFIWRGADAYDVEIVDYH